MYESHILPRNIHSYELVANSIKDFKDVYYYGKYDPFVENYLGEVLKVQPLRLSKKIKLTNNNQIITDSSISYLNSIGMII